MARLALEQAQELKSARDYLSAVERQLDAISSHQSEVVAHHLSVLGALDEEDDFEPKESDEPDE